MKTDLFDLEKTNSYIEWLFNEEQNYLESTNLNPEALTNLKGKGLNLNNESPKNEDKSLGLTDTSLENATSFEDGNKEPGYSKEDLEEVALILDLPLSMIKHICESIQAGKEYDTLLRVVEGESIHSLQDYIFFKKLEGLVFFVKKGFSAFLEWKDHNYYIFNPGEGKWAWSLREPLRYPTPEENPKKEEQEKEEQEKEEQKKEEQKKDPYPYLNLGLYYGFGQSNDYSRFPTVASIYANYKRPIPWFKKGYFSLDGEFSAGNQIDSSFSEADRIDQLGFSFGFGGLIETRLGTPYLKLKYKQAQESSVKEKALNQVEIQTKDKKAFSVLAGGSIDIPLNHIDFEFSPMTTFTVQAINDNMGTNQTERVFQIGGTFSIKLEDTKIYLLGRYTRNKNIDTQEQSNNRFFGIGLEFKLKKIM